MKREELLEAIGCVEESLLVETEQSVQRPRRSLWRLALVPAVAAMLAISVAAATGLFSQPINDSEIVAGEAESPVAAVDGSAITDGNIVGYRVCMKVEMDEDPPRIIERTYCLTPPEGWWACDSVNGWGVDVMTVWFRESYDQILLYQRTLEAAEVNFGENGVDRLWSMPGDVVLCPQVVTMAGLEMLRLDIPAEGMNQLVNGNGETRLYWSDGEYIMQLCCPSWMSDGEIEELLATLYVTESDD